MRSRFCSRFDFAFENFFEVDLRSWTISHLDGGWSHLYASGFEPSFLEEVLHESFKILFFFEVKPSSPLVEVGRIGAKVSCPNQDQAHDRFGASNLKTAKSSTTYLMFTEFQQIIYYVTDDWSLFASFEFLFI